MDFKIGDIIICININPLNNFLSAPPLVLNGEYIVQNTYTCSKCGNLSLEVGIPHRNANGSECSCGDTHHSDTWLCDSRRFVKKQSLSVTFTKRVEEEVLEKPLHSLN